MSYLTHRLFAVTVIFLVCQILLSHVFLRGECTSEALHPNEDVVSLVSTDIVVSVHNALPELKSMLASLQATLPKSSFRLFLVDDNSDEETVRFLEALQRSKTFPQLVVEHLSDLGTRGYSFAVNRGIALGDSPVVAVLNSDVILTDGWLEGLRRTLARSPSIAAVGPLSNAGSYQSVPNVYDESNGKRQWSRNPLPLGWAPNGVARAVRQLSTRTFPEVPFLNGFCILYRRAALQEIGLFDTELFPLGYGEENDLLLRLRNAGYVAVVDDATYIYHHKTRSFSLDERAQLSTQGRKALLGKHNRANVEELERQFQAVTTAALAPLRQRLRYSFQFPELFSSSTLRVLFLLPSSATGGGSTSVVQEALSLDAMGATVRILLWDKSFEKFSAVFPDARRLFFPWPKSAKSTKELASMYQYGSMFHAVISTIWVSVPAMLEMWRLTPNFLPMYYVQDYEPWFYKENTSNALAAAKTYSDVSGIGGVLYGKSSWIQGLVKDNHQALLLKVPGAIEQLCTEGDLSVRWALQPRTVKIVAMLRPSTPRRNPAQTLKVLQAAKRTLGTALEVITFGCSTSELRTWEETLPADLRSSPSFQHLGVLNRSGIALLFSRADVFLDLSQWQAFGRSAAEAMTCGCVPVITKQGGAEEFVHHQHNGFLVNSTDTTEVTRVIEELTANAEKLRLMQVLAAEMGKRLNIGNAVLSRLEIILRELRRRHPDENFVGVDVRTQ